MVRYAKQVNVEKVHVTIGFFQIYAGFSRAPARVAQQAYPNWHL